MKIAIDIRNIGKGRTGDEIVFFELVRHLALIDQDNEYHLLIDDRLPNVLHDIAARLGIVDKKNFRIIPCGSGNKFVWNAWTVQQYCRTQKIDLYHTQYIIPIFMPKETKIVTHIHDVSFRVYKDLIKKTDAFFLNTLIPYAIRHADHVIAISQFTKKEIITHYACPSEKITVILNAAVTHCDPSLQYEDVRVKYTLPQKYIMALGTMQPRKNIPFLLKVFADLAKERNDVSLVLVGKKDHNFDSAIRYMLTQNPHIAERVCFTGYVTEAEKCRLYEHAQVFVFPSLYEGFGVPILEALSMGTPVVISDIPPHREVAADVGLYCDPTNIDQWKRMLYDVLDNGKIREDIKKLSSTHIMNFSWERSARQLMLLYGSVCKRP